MSERSDLLTSIAHTIVDYRSGEIAPPTPQHVDRWTNQFHQNVQIQILQEVDYVLKQTYLSRKGVLDFLKELAKSKKLAGESPCTFWRKANFLRIQKNGKSQIEFLSLFDKVLKDECGYKTKNCGASEDIFVYIDDVMFSGNRVGNDLEKWIKEDAPDQATVHVIMMATHALGYWHIFNRLKKCIRDIGKKIEIKYWRSLEIENRKRYSNNSKVLWPADLPNDDALNAYLALPHKYPFEPRKSGGNLGYFSSESKRQLLEHELTLAGIKIRNFSGNPADILRPLGYSPFGLGFGSTIVTFRNCPNNCPLALWWGDPDASPNHPFSKWYPLFPRKTYD